VSGALTPASSLAVRRVTGHIASLKWTRPEYARRLKRTMGAAVDYSKRPSEDYASVVLEFETPDGRRVIGEASTSWSFVGAGLRLSAELLGPEYSMSWNSLDTGLHLFFSREVEGKAGEDLVEKQNAEVGLMPVVASEAAACPLLTLDNGLDVVKVLMSAYLSAEQKKTVRFPPRGLESFLPAVARGRWNPGD
jgi:hypothetical protein